MSHLCFSVDDIEAMRTSAARRFESVLAAWRERVPEVPLISSFVAERPRAALLRAAKGADLLALGRRGRGGMHGMLLGAVSHTALHHAACPVAVVHDGRTEQS